MGWEIKQYNLKTEVAELYDMRMKRKEGDPILTTNDITTHYGVVLPDESKEWCWLIWDDCADCESISGVCSQNRC